jgi:murein hydrolase activator
MASVAAQTDDAETAAREAQVKQRLEQVRGEIQKLAIEYNATKSQREDATRALREQELKVAAVVREVRAIEARVAGQQEQLDRSQAQRRALENKLKDQREALAALLRSAYALGRHEELKLLLAQENLSTLGRMLAYHRYFQSARISRIQVLLSDMDELAIVEHAIGEQTAALALSRDARQQELMQLQSVRNERAGILAELETALQDQGSRLAALGKDEKSVLELLQRIRDVFADIPKRIEGAEPFAQSKGRLRWPLRGRLVTAFGASEDGGQNSQGLLIEARNGSEVRAISHGRVAFADWLRGFGLLLIVDHGEGYLSLYGYNESLLKDVGDWVDANEVIATSGASGGRKTPGVYFELRYQGKPLDPRAWFRGER